MRQLVYCRDRASTAKQVDYLNKEIGKEKLSALTANIAFAGFTAPKILWVKENEPDNFNKICKIMLLINIVHMPAKLYVR